MGGVGKEEMAQWIQTMMSLAQEYERIQGRTIQAWEKGPADYRQVLAEGELPALLEKLREMPVPKDSECNEVKTLFERQVHTQIKEQALHAKYAGKTKVEGTELPRLPLPVIWPAASKSLLHFVINCLRLLRKKYQI